MKRTPLKSGGPIARNPDATRAWQDRSRKPLASGPGPARKTAIKKSNPARKAAERLRCYGPPERNVFVRDLRCFGCHSIAGSEPAHLVTDGMGRKADADKILPLCFWCHKEQHRVGNAEFAAARGLTVDDLFDAAAETERLWQLHAHS